MTLGVGDSFERVLVALLVGLLIGLDRERAEARKARRQFAGVRTFPLIALAGAVPVLLIDVVGPWLVAASFLAVAGVTLIAYCRSSASGDVGATTEVAALGTFLLGALAGGGELAVAGATGVAVAVLLVAKPRLERFSRALTKDELATALELAVVTVIVMPLVPNRGYGPGGVWNPFDIWLVVVMVCGLSFAGFVAMRWFGAQRGTLLVGAVGALVSSTAVTVAMARQSKASPRMSVSAAAAAVLASSVMCIRVAVFAGAYGAGVLPRLLPGLALMAGHGMVVAWWLGRRTSREGARVDSTQMRNPFSLATALVFGLVYAMVLIVVHAAEKSLGTSGLYAAAALSSLADVDAVAIAFAGLGARTGDWATAAVGILIASIVNTIVKLVVAVVLGSNRFRRDVSVALTTMALLGALAGLVSVGH